MRGACGFEGKLRLFAGCGSCEEIVSPAVVLTMFAREVLVTTDAKDKLLDSHVARAYRI